ncbi:MAG TPA: tRNA dihydrouridine synthase DusB [Pyrinomonadaceae bacterium]|jgi:nifR3 family TIM-barrel protein|nr:tRNA dihydrouridine synthase DusB [Pyrinomonadaceae bacterium]
MTQIKPFKIRDIEINPPLVLSPMAGVTDISFRRLLKQRGGIGLTVSEFISVEGLTRNNPKSKRQMRFYENERPFAVQIFGGQPERMRMAAEMAEEVGADILDVNCGCPAPKVVKHGGGSGLLKDHERLETILNEIKKAISIPMTVKIRAGYYDHMINAIETAKLAEACGAEHIALHGRTKEQGYRGLANWDLVREIKQAVSVPVSGSGDVATIQQAFDRFRETGCDGVLIGRGAMANPWIFRQIEDAMQAREPFQPTLEDKRALLLEYFEMLQQDMPQMAAIGRMKQLAGQFTRGLQGGALFRTALYHSHSVAEILDRISEYFETITAGKQYFGETGPPRELIEAPVLDSCEAASV